MTESNWGVALCFYDASMMALPREVEMTHYTVRLTTERGTIYTYAPLAASCPREAINIICASWAGQLPCTGLRQVGERQWEGASSDGVFVQVWES